VELTISGGSTLVPEVTGYSREEAVEMLHQSSLTEANAVFVYTTDPDQIGQVLEQNPAAGTMMALGSPVTLSVGVESQPYQGELELIIPESADEHVLRVMLLIDDREVTKYEGTILPGSERVMKIPINANIEGDVPCVIYLDDELYGTISVALY